MGRFTRVLLVLLCMACLVAMLIIGDELHTETVQETLTTDAQTGVQTVKKAEKVDINDIHLRDNDLLYANDIDTSVVTMYLTVSRGNPAENTDHSWEEINTYSVYDYDDMGVERYQIAGLLQVGDENGPLEGELGYNEVVPNATVQIRGQSSSRNEQKNYKIEVKQGKGEWRGQRTISLNKHTGDMLRFRNKLAYDMIEDIPQLMGLRTQFVHLWVKDTTGDNPEEFVDYGLYTQVEQLNRTAMRAHGLDRDGHLYKINEFGFSDDGNVIRLQSDPLYDQKAFEMLLEPKGNTDHSKLINMVEAVSDVSISANELLDLYFDEENVAYWMAFQILIGNNDTQNRNCYIYSPLNSDRWYFICWDHDGGLSRNEYKLEGRSWAASWESGVSNYWGNRLFQRLLKSESFRDVLDTAIEDLYSKLNTERINGMVNDYVETVKPYVFSMPDVQYIGVTEEQYDMLAGSLAQEVENSYKLYKESLEKPMPFWIGTPVSDGEKLSLHWDASYDFDAETIMYTVELARDYLFENVVFKEEGVLFPEIETGMMEPGQYFLRVRATNTSGYTQDALDCYIIDSGKVYGTRCFYVLADGSIEVDVYEQ